MIIKYSKDYLLKQTMRESDRIMLKDFDSVTYPSTYYETWKEADVTLEQLQEYVNKGYAIKINC